MRPSTFTVSRRMTLRRRTCAEASPEIAITLASASGAINHLIKFVERMTFTFGLPGALLILRSVARLGVFRRFLLLVDLALRGITGSSLLLLLRSLLGFLLIFLGLLGVACL